MELSWLSILFLGAASGAAALETITAKGNRFFLNNGTQFFLKGIAYQLTPDDPLIDGEQCERDAQLMKTLGANSIRVYHVDATADHDRCMSTFAAAGIYAIIDLDTFETYILPNDPGWNQTQHDRYAQVMDAFHDYENVLGFFVGNEIIAEPHQSIAAPFIKAAVRDMKAYRDAKGYRRFPIGYSATDIAQLRPMLQDYLTCGGNASENIDFFSLNSYEWCGNVTYEQSGYAALQGMTVNYPVPIFFSETGCNQPRPRTFADQAAIFGEHMVNDWSGSIVYEWIQEANDYGLISYGPPVPATATGDGIYDGFLRKGQPTPIVPEFENLQRQWATLHPTGLLRDEYDAGHVSTRACPTSASTDGYMWLVDGNVALPTIGETFAGTFSSAPTLTPLSPASDTGGVASPSSGDNAGSASPVPANPASDNPASPNKQLGFAGVALTVVMLIFAIFA